MVCSTRSSNRCTNRRLWSTSRTATWMCAPRSASSASTSDSSRLDRATWPSTASYWRWRLSRTGMSVIHPLTTQSSALGRQSSESSVAVSRSLIARPLRGRVRTLRMPVTATPRPARVRHGRSRAVGVTAVTRPKTRRPLRSTGVTATPAWRSISTPAPVRRLEGGAPVIAPWRRRSRRANPAWLRRSRLGPRATTLPGPAVRPRRRRGKGCQCCKPLCPGRGTAQPEQREGHVRGKRRESIAESPARRPWKVKRARVDLHAETSLRG